jgi:hypothetical protein
VKIEKFIFKINFQMCFKYIQNYLFDNEDEAEIEIKKLISYYEYLVLRMNVPNDYSEYNEMLKEQVLNIARGGFEDPSGFVALTDLETMYSFKYSITNDSTSRLKIVIITDSNNDEAGFVIPKENA